MITKAKRTFVLSFAALLFLGLLMMAIFRVRLFDSLEYGDNIYVIATRFTGGIACLLFIFLYSKAGSLSPKTTPRSFFIFLPCMAVAVNNFPFIPFFKGEAYVEAQPLSILLYALECLAVGFFEEMAFRECIFTAVLGRSKRRTVDVFWAIVISSAIFGAVHIFNVFAGGSVGAVILQVGYSFLIGGMCSVVLVRTSNIWYCIVLHATYNFAGGIVPRCGGGTIWTAPEIVLTAVVAVAVTVYVIFMLAKTSAEDIDRLLK